MAEPDSNTAPVDFNWLYECTDNDMDALKTLLEMYFTRTAGLISDLEKALAAGNAPEVGRLAHMCSGSSGTCGMVKLVPLFKELEKLGAAGTLTGEAGARAAALGVQIRAEFKLAGDFAAGKLKT